MYFIHSHDTTPVYNKWVLLLFYYEKFKRNYIYSFLTSKRSNTDSVLVAGSYLSTVWCYFMSFRSQV